MHIVLVIQSNIEINACSGPDTSLGPLWGRAEGSWLYIHCQ